jgi:response regulator RpfG family c-di-GMP phosphodiesterase
MREAVQELRRCAGTQFDPAVMELFVAELDAALVTDEALG